MHLPRPALLGVLLLTALMATGCASATQHSTPQTSLSDQATQSSTQPASDPVSILPPASPVSIVPPTRTSSIPVPKTSAPVRHAVAPTSKPKVVAPPAPRTSQAPVQQPPPPASCYPLTNGGNCYEPGEFCRNSDHGMTGLAGDGERIRCEDNNGWRWEPA